MQSLEGVFSYYQIFWYPGKFQTQIYFTNSQMDPPLA